MKKFENYAANLNNPKWNYMIKRETPLYSRENDLRNEFQRDYTRIIHSNAYKRLKHKTQVFFSPENDHICTRIEHVTLVESISYTIADYLGLNTELTKAISIAHDLGHSPFGHVGEKILSILSENDIGFKFWHEKNGLNFVDNIELLEDNNRNYRNLNLTYAVRDGIISHCGEINENELKPRDQYIDLNDYNYPNQYSPYTWEACVVKISDKISYIYRDIIDAIELGILDEKLDELYDLLEINKSENIINNTTVLNTLIKDLCENSTPEKGLCFSNKALNLINKIKKFNYENIYTSKRIQPSNRFFEVVIKEIYYLLKSTYEDTNTLKNIEKFKRIYPKLYESFTSFINNYYDIKNREDLKLKNKVLFSFKNEKDFYKSIIYFIAGMTDNFAIEIYKEIIKF